MPFQYPRPNLNLANSALRTFLNDFIYATQQRFIYNIKVIVSNVPPLNISVERQLWVDVYSYALQMAAVHGHADVVRCLMERCPTGMKENMLRVYKAALRKAANNGHTEVVNCLFSNMDVFRYAEMNDPLFARYLHPYIDRHLQTFMATQQAFQASNPGRVFDIREDEFNFHHYALRNLVRRNNPDLITRIRQLLKLPYLARRLDYDRDGRSNDIYQLSIEIHNELATTALWEVPNVRSDAGRNGNYVHDNEGLSMREPSRHTESSMRKFQHGEQRIVDHVKARYRRLMEETGGKDIVFNQLKTYLKERYIANPARIVVNGRVRPLPVDWDSFTRMTLNEAERSLALKAYYQHIIHTAHRFLLKPNPWITNRSTCWIDSDKSGQFAQFREHIELIAYFWLAVNDQALPATDGQSIAGRQEFFIHSLALIGRAKNWIRTEAVDDTSEHDNLGPDYPSCTWGIQLRLFQAVTGHPLFAFLTMNLLQNELNERIRAYFVALLAIKTEGERQAINRDVSRATIYMEAPSIRLRALNISVTRKQAWIDELSIKYGMEFDDTPAFLAYIYEQLDIAPGEAHITQFPILHEHNLILRPSPRVDDLRRVEARVLTRPAEIVPAVDTNELYRTRFNAVSTPGTTRLDLSACRLNELTPSEMYWFLRQLRYIPRSVTHISFKNNGFQGNDERTRVAYLAFTEALRFISPSVINLDLSGNGFETFSHQSFGALFRCFPKGVRTVSIAEGRPAVQTASINWPKSYYDMTTRALAERNVLAVAQILLSDYTKGNSALMRFFTFHWQRHHAASVATIVDGINMNLLDVVEGMQRLRSIVIQNDYGSYARRLSFIEHLYAQCYPAAVFAPQHHTVGTGLEMTTVRVGR